MLVVSFAFYLGIMLSLMGSAGRWPLLVAGAALVLFAVGFAFTELDRDRRSP